jgi:hypothetical protein
MLFFTKIDFNKTLSQLYGGLTLDALDLTRKDYYACKNIYYNYKYVWEESIELYQVQLCGFKTMNDMRIAFIKSKIYNDVHRYPDVPLQTYVQWCIGKDKDAFEICKNNTINNNECIVSINLIDLLDTFETNSLMCLRV